MIICMRSEAQKRADKWYEERAKENYKRFTFRIPIDIADKFDQLCLEKGTTRTELFKKWIDEN